MWSRFTEAAKRVVYFAQEEARHRGECNVGTEHLLLGLLYDEENGVGFSLQRLGVSPEQVRSEIEARLTTAGPAADVLDMQLSPAAKRVVDLAYDEARLLRHRYIGTEHLFIGLLRQGDGMAAQVLTQFGIDLGRARTEIRRFRSLVQTASTAAVPAPPGSPAQPDEPLTEPGSATGRGCLGALLGVTTWFTAITFVGALGYGIGIALVALALGYGIGIALLALACTGAAVRALGWLAVTLASRGETDWRWP